MFFSFKKAAESAAYIHNDVHSVKNMRKQIFNMKDNLAGSSQYAKIFYSLISDINHPPCYIEWTEGGVYWTQNWEPYSNNYEPYSTTKFQDVNIGVIETSAVFLLIQDSYPSVYDFPTNTMPQIQSGTATYKLVMKKQYYGKTIIPAYAPNKPITPTAGMNTNLFCSACGKQITPDTVFCPGCGSKVQLR